MWYLLHMDIKSKELWLRKILAMCHLTKLPPCSRLNIQINLHSRNRVGWDDNSEIYNKSSYKSGSFKFYISTTELRTCINTTIHSIHNHILEKNNNKIKYTKNINIHIYHTKYHKNLMIQLAQTVTLITYIQKLPSWNLHSAPAIPRFMWFNQSLPATDSIIPQTITASFQILSN